MGTLETLYFPDTIIAKNGQSPLFLLFGRVHYLRPVETDPGQTAGLSDTFMDTAFCQAHTPAPLGADRTRFLRLITDIRQRKDDYAAQLSSLAIASMSAPRSGDENAPSAILSTLMGGAPSQGEKEKDARRAELWQARLVLAMAEILDREEEEIAQALNLLDQSKADLFSRLLGKDGDVEDNNPFCDLAQLQERVNLPRPGMIKNRLKAWLSLYRSGAPACWLWTTPRREAADILLEMLEKKTGKTALTFWQLEMPVAEGPGLTTDEILTFRKAAESLLTGIAGTFDRLVRQESAFEADPAGLLPEGLTWSKEWAALLETHFPAGSYGRIPLHFYFFPDISLPELAAARIPATGIRHGILGVLG